MNAHLFTRSARALAFAGALAAITPPAAVADDDTRAQAGQPPAGDVRKQLRTVEAGMQLDEALALIGRGPDSNEHIGAGCGFLDVARWEAEGVNIISNNGVVTSVAVEER